MLENSSGIASARASANYENGRTLWLYGELCISNMIENRMLLTCNCF